METEQDFASQLESELNRFTGDVERWRHGFNPSVIYSPGVRHLMERAGAHWLIDAIVSYLVPAVMYPVVQRDRRIGGLHFWRLEVRDDQSAQLFAEAGLGEKPFLTQEIEHTDFPLRRVAVWAGFDGEHWVLYLPSEH